MTDGLHQKRNRTTYLYHYIPLQSSIEHKKRHVKYQVISEAKVVKGKPGKEREEEAGELENPCLEVLERFQFAKTEQEILLEAYVAWQSTIRELEELYWKTSKAAYWSGVVARSMGRR